MRKLGPLLGGLVVLLAAGSLGAGAQATSQGASARAFAVSISIPGQSGASSGEVTAPPDAVSIGQGFAYPADGSIFSSGSITASASAAVAKASATAQSSSRIQSLWLFGGEIAADSVAAGANAQASARGASGDLSGTAIEGLTVLGQGVTPQPGARIPLADWGYALTLARGSSGSKQGYRGFVTALEIHVTADHDGLPAGSVISIGFAEAVAAAPPPETTSTKTTTHKTTSTGQQTTTSGQKKKPREQSKQDRGLRRPPPAVNVKLTPGGYVFPVYGPCSFTDTFGAPRADVSWHHGEDIFAPLGAPLLAVADGTVFSVGWNDLGGNRLWLRDSQGNEFYYAHLSAYSPLAVNGRRVGAGDVLGFVGNTGDADGTPFHLHFEIHPVSLLGLGYDGVISPYEYLLAWRRLADIKFTAGARWLPEQGSSNAPEPGAYLLSARDISSVSGIEPGTLRRALALASRRAGGTP